MPINLNNITPPVPSDSLTNPRDIFVVLPNKAAKYQYPRDVQGEIWSAWYARRNEHDLVLKMNTGAGKTVVGLLILQSCINDNCLPAAYFAPDRYLVGQVLAEAHALGIATTEDPRSASFLTGKAILVTTIHKLFNGRSVFGLQITGPLIPIGALIVDDTHACLATVEQQFAIVLTSESPVYGNILSLFHDDLDAQAPTTLLDIEAEDPGKVMLVPYWAWQDKQKRVVALLHDARDSDELRFVWPLLSELLPHCQCVIGNGRIEITPRAIPIGQLPSFVAAQRRLFMSATLADDSVLVTHFDVDVEAARTPLTPQLATDVGDRLVLTPQELDPDLTDEDLRQLTHEISQLHNTVVLVPSFARADLWRSQAPLVLSAENIAEGVARLRREHVGLVVIVNKYDGIDLPDDACRLLVLDGVPEVRRGIDRIEESALYGTPEQLAQAMQRVEQGMGRGVRSTDDRCAVMLMGRSLVRHLYSAGAMAYLTPATRAQVELSRRIGEQIRSGGLSELRQALAVVLDRDSKWIALSRAATVQVRYNATGTVSESAESLRRSFNQVLAEDIHGAIATVQEHVNAATEQRSLGWHKQYLAELTNFVDQVAAQVIQKAARADNIVALKPLAGIEYVTMRTAGSDQAQSAATFMRTRYANGNELAVDVYGHLEALQFYAGTAEPFEAAFAWLAELLGFASQRPEKEYGHGPDVLWSLGGLSYFVIEAKNGVTTGIISKDHANQLAGSIHWFRQRYDSSCTVTPVLAHPSTRLGPAATTPPDTRVIDIAGLRQLKDEVRHVVTAIGNGSWPPQPDTLRQLLMRHHLHAGTLLQRFSSVPRAR